MPARLEPKLVTLLREGYSPRQFGADVAAGVTVGIVALPLAIAFAIASGVKPEQGLYTAIIAGFVIAALGGSRAQISGPTGAFIVIIYDIVQRYGYDGLAVATLIAGFILVAMGLAKMGTLLKFIPYPVTVGFTSGIALIIFSGQIRDFLGLRMESVPAGFVEKWIAFSRSAHTVSPSAVLVGVAALAIMMVWPRITHRIPGSLVAILVLTAAVGFFAIPVETIGTRFGEVPSHFPAPHVPRIGWAVIKQMFSPALTIAFLAALESLLAAVVADGMLGTRHRSNMELVAQGVGNIVSPLFLGIPATGAIARTATNIKYGGRTPIAAMTHSLTLLAILLFFGRWASLIPMPVLSAILFVVAWNMSERRAFRQLLRAPKSDVAVLLTTFGLTVLIDLTFAIQVGVGLAAALFLQRMSDVTQVTQITKEIQEELGEGEERPDNPIPRLEVPPGVEIFEISGSLFFGAIDRFKEALLRIEAKPRVLIIRMRGVVSIDASGLQSLEDLLERTARDRTWLLLSGVGAQPRDAMRQSGLSERIGSENILENIHVALARARDILEVKPDREGREPDERR
jgi:SulP family sulfate permease